MFLDAESTTSSFRRFHGRVHFRLGRGAGAGTHGGRDSGLLPFLGDLGSNRFIPKKLRLLVAPLLEGLVFFQAKSDCNAVWSTKQTIIKRKVDSKT